MPRLSGPYGLIETVPMARHWVAVVSVIVALISSRWLDLHLVAAPVSLLFRRPGASRCGNRVDPHLRPGGSAGIAQHHCLLGTRTITALMICFLALSCSQPVSGPVRGEFMLCILRFLPLWRRR